MGVLLVIAMDLLVRCYCVVLLVTVWVYNYTFIVSYLLLYGFTCHCAISLVLVCFFTVQFNFLDVNFTYDCVILLVILVILWFYLLLYSLICCFCGMQCGTGGPVTVCFYLV